MARFGIRLSTAGSGEIQRQIRLPGEIVINADRSAHVVPPASGIARKVMVKIGDPVGAHQELVAVESTELSEAKTEYLAKLSELSCCAMELTRAEELDASAKQLLAALAKSPGLEQLQALRLATMGELHSALIAAYANLVFAKEEYEREKRLVADDVSSKADYQTATNAYKKATAEYIAARDALDFKTQQALLEARQKRQVLELELAAIARKLRILGVSAKEIKALAAREQGKAEPHECNDPNCTDCAAGHGKAAKPTTQPAQGDHDHGHEDGEAEPHECDDPNCTDCATEGPAGASPAAEAHNDNDHDEDRLGMCSVRAPFAGVVVEKHVTRGELLSGDESIFTIADLSSVWVDLSVYQKDLPFVRKGQRVHISVGRGIPAADGRIAFVSPIVDRQTRTATARIILSNPNGIYRPGLFVTAEIDVSGAAAAVVIPKAAVLRIESENVVFVPGDEGLVAKPVRLGRSSRTHVEILEGLQGGQRYVAVGAFKLKAELVTSGLGAHAGHGH
jgi:multidrug efflux pump subunit AcrA (membrane-fusion protein)